MSLLCSNEDKEFYRFLEKHSNITVKDIAKNMRVDTSVVHKKINRLKKLGMINDKYERRIKVKKFLFLP